MILNADLNAESLKISKDIYLRILGKAVAQTQNDIKDLESALPVSDIEKLQSISHRLKGDYDNMRVTVLSTIARELNLETKAGRDKQKMFELITQFKINFAQLELELAGLVKK